jgi:hypothetical protein
MRLKSLAKAVLSERFYSSLRNLQYTRTASFLRAAPRFPAQLLYQHANAPYFPFDFRIAIGMGAMLTHIVQLLAYAEQNKLLPACRISNPLYSSGADAFSEYFALRSQKCPAGREPFFYTIRTAEDYTLFRPAAELPLAEMSRVFHKYLTFSPRVCDTVENFRLTVPRFPRLGIHYRGTDKRFEAPEVDYELVFTTVEAHLDAIDADLVFFATDSSEFSQAIRSRFPWITFISYDSDVNLKIDGPRRFSGLSADAKAMEAIINMLLLSRCDVCIRTASQLSVWSRILNSDLKTVSLNRPFMSTAYPEGEIWNEENASPSSC